MASRYQNFIKGIGLVPNATDANTKKGDINVTSADGKLNYHNGTSSSPAVTEAHTAELTNKTIGDNLPFKGSTSGTTTLIADAVASGTLTLPAATDTLVGKVTADVFENKTLDFDTGTTGNVISNIPDGALTANVMLLNAAQTVDGAKSFDVGTFLLNGAISGSTTINAEAIASGIIVVPATNDTLVGKATTDTFTNKTFDTADVGNVLKINTVQVTDVTGTGKVVLDTSPTLTTPTVDQINGAAGGTLLIQSSVNEDVSIQAPGSGNVVIENFQFNGAFLSSTTGSPIDITAATGNITLTSFPTANIVLNTKASFDTDASGATGTAITVTTNKSHISFVDSGLVSIAGFVANRTGEVIFLSNNTGNPITILNDNASAVFSDRIYTGTGADITVENNSTVAIIWTGYLVSHWMVVGGVGGGATTINVLAGENIAAGDAVYISQGAADGGRTAGSAYKLDATNDNRIDFIGIAQAAISSGSAGKVLVIGEAAGFTGLVEGLPVYASVTTPGSYQTTAPTGSGQWIIQLGTATATTKLSINGSGSATASKIAQFSGSYLNRSSVSSNTILTNNNDVVLVSAASGAISITLPSPSDGKLIYVKKTDSTVNAVNIIPSGIDTIDGNPRYSLLGQYDAVQMISDGTNWFII